MRIDRFPLRDKYRTVQEIKDAVDCFYNDIGGFPKISRMTFLEFYDFVKKIPYIRDVKNLEVVSRPRYLLTIFNSLDCKKKSILIASYMRFKHGPSSYRFCLSSNRPDKTIGHIFTQVKVNGQWKNADATYSRNKFGQQKSVTALEIIKG
jgi:hypothetical protein